MELDNEIKTGLDISSEAEVLNFPHTGAFPKNITARVILGSTTNGIVGAGSYTLTIYINGIRVSPVSVVEVTAVNRTVFESRIFSILSGDTVSLRVTGLAGDILVDTDSTIIDYTPFTQAELEDALSNLSIVIDDPDAFVAALGGIIQVGTNRTVLGPCARGTVLVNRTGSGGPIVTIKRIPAES